MEGTTMKTNTKFFFAALLIAACTMSVQAQQVNTLFFLENAPMRHTINPAFQPVSKGYINFTPLGWTTIGLGNNSLTISNAVYVDPNTGKTITAFYPGQDKQAFLRNLRSMTDFTESTNLGILNLGLRIKENGFLTIGLNERIEADITMPKHLFNFFAGGMALNNQSTTYDLHGLGAGATMYTEISGGYSHKINEQWTVGGKL